MGDKDRFDEIISSDTEREDNLLLPIVQDVRFGRAFLAECFPEFELEVDIDATLKEIARDQHLDESLVLEAFERAKAKFERHQEHGY